MLGGQGYFRGVSDLRTPLVIEGAANALNVGLVVLFVYGFGWGIRGSAAGTAIAWTCMGAAFFVRLHRGTRGRLGLRFQLLRRLLGMDAKMAQYRDGAAFPAGELIQPKIEPEIAFIMDRDLKGPGVTAIQVLAATRFVVPALEIIDSRIEGWRIKLCDTIADNASSARVVLGATPKRVDQIDLRLVGMMLKKNGEVVQTGAGAAVLGPVDSRRGILAGGARWLR